MNVVASSSALRRQPHPSPHRGRVGRWSIWFGIIGAPLAWNLQLLVNASLVSHGCYPHDVPLASPIWSDLRTVTTAVDAVAVAICIAAGIAAWLSWRRSRDEKPGTARHLVGNGDGRTRFMAMSGMMTSALFLMVTGVSAVTLAAVPACGG